MSTSKVVKFKKINLLKTRLEIVGDVKVVVVENSGVKSPFGKVQVGEARRSPVEKKEAGNHQVEIEARSQKRKRLEENFEDSPSKYILNGTKIIKGGKFQIYKFSNVQNLGSRGPQGNLQLLKPYVA